MPYKAPRYSSDHIRTNIICELCFIIGFRIACCGNSIILQPDFSNLSIDVFLLGMLKTVWSFITHKKRNNQFSDRRQISEIKGYKDIFVLWGEIWTVYVKLRRCTIVRRLKKFGKIKHSFKFCWPFPKTQLLFLQKDSSIFVFHVKTRDSVILLYSDIVCIIFTRR